MNTIVREAEMEDYEGVCAVIDEVDQLHRERFPNRYRKSPDGVVRPREYIESLINEPNAGLLVAEQGGEIIGVLTIHLRDTPPIDIVVPRRYGLVSDVVVRHDRRRQGVALALMQAAEAWARANGADTMELNVYCFNQDAIRFYQGLGYETITQKMAKTL